MTLSRYITLAGNTENTESECRSLKICKTRKQAEWWENSESADVRESIENSGVLIDILYTTSSPGSSSYMAREKWEDPGKGNTAEKRLRMHQIMKIWRGIWISIS
jgi:hypothetical protein